MVSETSADVREEVCSLDTRGPTIILLSYDAANRNRTDRKPVYGGWFSGGPIDGSSVSAPETLKLVGDHLVWSADGTARKIEVGDILQRFLALETPERGNQDVFNFARDFGPLWLCQDHGFVAFHQPIDTMGCALVPETSNAPSRDPFRPLPGVTPTCWPRMAQKSPDLYSESQSQWSRAAVLFSEPVSQWRSLAANANRLLDAAATMQRGAEVSAETWHQIDGYAPDDPQAQILSDPRERLAENLNRWLAIADVRFHVGIEGRAFGRNSARTATPGQSWR